MGESAGQSKQRPRRAAGYAVESTAERVQSRSAPAPAEFPGGAHQMAAGNTAYVTVDLEPGRYAWVSNSSDEKGMEEVFTVG